jgi:hypothetical protein
MTAPSKSVEIAQKRRSSRIAQRIPINVDGIDMLGQPFKEKTFTVVISSHGCSYSSKHHVPRNALVTLGVPSATSALPPRSTVARVVWVRRPHSVKELFTISVEFRTPGGIWGITPAPDDWVSYRDGADQPVVIANGGEDASPDSATPMQRRRIVASGPDSEVRYDVALSFAGEDRKYVEETAEVLRSRGVRTFYDKYEVVPLWGKNLYTHLDEIYRRQAKYTVMFISRHYANKVWTNRERESAQARAFEESREYILPARFDDTSIPGLLPTVGHVDLRTITPSELADLIIQKLRSA